MTDVRLKKWGTSTTDDKCTASFDFEGFENFQQVAKFAQMIRSDINKFNGQTELLEEKT